MMKELFLIEEESCYSTMDNPCFIFREYIYADNYSQVRDFIESHPELYPLQINQYRIKEHGLDILDITRKHKVRKACPKCNKERTSKFCPDCGSKVESKFMYVN